MFRALSPVTALCFVLLVSREVSKARSTRRFSEKNITWAGFAYARSADRHSVDQLIAKCHSNGRRAWGIKDIRKQLGKGRLKYHLQQVAAVSLRHSTSLTMVAFSTVLPVVAFAAVAVAAPFEGSTNGTFALDKKAADFSGRFTWYDITTGTTACGGNYGSGAFVSYFTIC